jgi:uncharacterized protein
MMEAGIQQYFQPVPNLPIFEWKRKGMAWFYSPGLLAVLPEEKRLLVEENLDQASPHFPLATTLREHAIAAQKAYANLFQIPYTPVCLTIYLNNRCNLSCEYCYSMSSPARTQSKLGETVSLQAVNNAAKLVANNCQAQNLPFTLVLHGGGEPTLDWKLADQILNIVEQTTAEKALPVFRYIATNGVMSPRVANWLMKRFDLIGLSCDGPPHIQNIQRPLNKGLNSTPYIERLAKIAREAGKPIHVRVTLSRSSMKCQEEIAHYLCQRIFPQEIRVEPIYQGGRANAQSSLELKMVETYVDQFMQARRVAADYGVNWCSTGTRLGNVYGPYCHIFRDVLNLVPGDFATACFRTSQFSQNSKRDTLIGWQTPSAAGFFLDDAQIQSNRRMLNSLPDRCAACLNRYHCTKGCPDRCPVEIPGDDFTPAANFRCQLQAALAFAMIDELVPRTEANKIYTATIDAQQSGRE